MSDKTAIEWTDATWNPTRGCSRVSLGCVNCYAERVAMRFSGPGQPYEGLVKMVNGKPTWTGAMRMVPEMLEVPLKWKRPRMIFVDSMSDLFHAGVPFDYIDKVFAIMAMCPQHTFQVLTKRADRMLEYVTSRRAVIIHEAAKGLLGYDNPKRLAVNDWPLRNVWMGVSAEDQERANERVPLLLQTPAAVRWVSAEPLLAGLDLRRWLNPTGVHCIDVCFDARYVQDEEVETFTRGNEVEPFCPACGEAASWTGFDPGIDWVVAGGESGPHARESNPQWYLGLRDQCATAGVPFLFKQWGEWGDGDSIEKKGTAHNGWWEDDPEDGGVPQKEFPGPMLNGIELASQRPVVYRVGKKHTGRFLDGVEHNGYPERA